MPLDEEFSSVFFEVGTRKGGALGGTPSEIHLYGSNVEDPQNEQDWFKFAESEGSQSFESQLEPSICRSSRSS